MRGHFIWIVMALAGIAAGSAHAQAVSPAPSNMQAESLAPLARAASASAVVSASVAEPAVAAVIDPFTVKNVTVVLSDTTGFARDAALEKAARQAMPTALMALPMDKAKAASTARSVGSVMNFVGSYRIVKETIVPTYSLTVDLTFNATLLRKNFGGAVAPVSVAASGTVVDVSGSSVATSGTEVPVMQRWVVKVQQSDPGALDKIMVTLNGTTGTHAVYRLLTSAGAELMVETPLDATALTALVGNGAQVTAADGAVVAPTGAQ